MRKIILGIGAMVAAGSTAAVTAEAKSGSQRPVVVVAEPEAMPSTRRVAYADLDLATQVGERALVRRVRSAVDAVCEEELGPSPLVYSERACRMFTWNDTRPQVDRAIARAHGMAAARSPGIVAATIIVRAAE
jgi:UrcA family protein